MSLQSFESDFYRYGFQGQEKDDDWNGNGNSYEFKYRIHDARLGRFLSIDPLSYQYVYNSPYAFSENRTYDMIELEGREIVSAIGVAVDGGVAHIDIAGEGSIGIGVVGVALKGALGVGYDDKGNIALYTQVGGFAELFSAIGGPVVGGGNPDGEFTISAGASIELEESYDFGIDNVLDLSGESSSFDVGFGVYNIIGADVGINLDKDNDWVGVNWGTEIGTPGPPASVGKLTTTTYLIAFNTTDITRVTEAYNEAEQIIALDKEVWGDDVSISIIPLNKEDGSTELLFRISDNQEYETTQDVHILDMTLSSDGTALSTTGVNETENKK